jgi:predicted fused transcriptional regulator/phosphomethylpyrimidine kinase
VDLLGIEPKIFELIPDSGSNLGMAIPGAVTPDDVALVEGGLVEDGRRARPSGCIKFGTNGDIARTILAAMSRDPRARAAMNLSPRALPACKALGLAIMELNRFDDSDAIPVIDCPGLLRDVILVQGATGEGARLYLLGASATLLAQRAVDLARGLEYRKI